MVIQELLDIDIPKFSTKHMTDPWIGDIEQYNATVSGKRVKVTFSTAHPFAADLDDFAIPEKIDKIWVIPKEIEITQLAFQVYSRKYGTGHYAVELTGGGKVFSVMSFVYKAIMDFMSKNNPDFLVFTADLSEPSRVKLYKLLSIKLAKMLGYNVYMDTEDEGYNLYAKYVLISRRFKKKKKSVNPKRKSTNYNRR